MGYYEDNCDSRTGLEIAVVGMAARFPGAKDINEFWDNLKNGRETIKHFTDDELRKMGVSDEIINNPNYVRARGMLQDKDKFDPLFFGFTPAEAQLMSPQMRVMHECVWNALEHSGYNPFTYKRAIGLYAGASSSAHWSALTSLSQRNKDAGAFASNMLTDKDQICTQISYNLNLKGPSFVLQTACSTSLVAIHLACQGLLSGECSMALAGGLSLSTIKEPGYIFMEGSIYSPDGYCRAFDEKANGTVESEGVGIVVLKTLEDAIADGDTIHAIICSSAINNDGNRKVGYTAPSAEGQAKVIRAAYQAAEIEPETISYIETHGTGTNMGDPIEMEALKWAFNTKRKGFCKLGSVKSNIGHTIEAAGVASLIKTVLSLKNKQIPPTLHISNPNPKIDFKNTPFVLNTSLTDWDCGGNILRAGVSSFGIGGTNAHVILEEAPAKNGSTSKRKNHLICLSGKTKLSLQQRISDLSNYLQEDLTVNLADLSYTLQTGRNHFNFRKAFYASTINEALNNLTSNEASIGFGNVKKTSSVCFMFSGQGAQYVNMALGLYQTEPVFKRELEKCFEIAKKHSVIDLEKLIFSEEGLEDATDKLKQTENTQPALFVIEYAMAKFLMELGITPNYLIGHSIGEYVAACISGVFSLEDAVKIVLLRGKLMQQTERGTMLSVALSEEEVAPYLNKNISIAAINTTGQTVLSGENGAIKELKIEMEAKGVKCVSLHTSHAFHSYLMDPILEEFKSVIGEIKLDSPSIPFISNLTGQFITEEQAKDPTYWAQHIRKPVKFAAGLETIMKEAKIVFAEVGPGKSLCTFVRQNESKSKEDSVIHLIRHPKESISDENCFWNGLGSIWASGVEIKWEELYNGEDRFRIPLPTYPFDRKRFWIDEDFSDYFKGQSKEDFFENLLERTDKIDDWFYVPTWEQSPLFDNKRKNSVKNILLFIDSVGFGDLLVKKLIKDDSNIIVINKGASFIQESDSNYHLNPENRDDYLKLIESVLSSGLEIDTIIHCWNIYHENNTEIGIYDAVQDAGFYSVINLVQALGNKGIKNKISIDVITNNIHEVTGSEAYLSPEKATLLGAVKVIPLEYTNLECKSIDIDLPFDLKLITNDLADKIISEINIDSDENIVALRGNYRWVPGIKKTNLGNNIELPVFKKEGVYLITGGFGGLGFSFATHIAENFNAGIVLVDRKELPERNEWDRLIKESSQDNAIGSQLKKIIDLEKNGARFLTFKSDISDYQQMSELVDKAEKEFGEINGIIHTAGVIDFEGVIQNRTREMTELSFAPKVKGPLVLDKIFDGKKLDMFVLFSSVGTYIYKMKFGQVGYNAGNNFLDAFTFYLRRKGIKSYTLNWSDWLEVGMSLESAKHTAKKEGREFTYDYFVNEQSYAPIAPSEGIEAFVKAVGSGFPRLAINSCDLVGAVNYLQKYGAPTASNAKDDKLEFDRPELDTEYVAPKNKVEELIVEKWCKLFGIKDIGVHDDFFELGGDSLKGMTFINSIIDIIGEVIHVSAIFEAPTAAKFANYLAENYVRSYAKISGEKEKISKEEKVVDKKLLLVVKKMIPELSGKVIAEKKKNKRAIFIISPPRTGSTLLRVMLAGHTQLFAPPELDLLPFATLKERKNYYANTSGTTDEGPIKAIMQIKDCKAEEARSLMKEMEDKDFNVQQFYNQLQEWVGDRILVDKSPGYSTNIDILKRAELYFEDAVYIHLLRHPYGMIRSYDEAKLDLIEGTGLLKKLNLSRLNLAELSWTIGNENIVEFLKDIPAERKFSLKFEDLVNKPEMVMNDLCNVIGIEFQEDLLKPYKEKNKRMTDGVKKSGLMIGDVKFHKHKEISKDVANTWKNIYKEDFLGEETIRLANKFGYELINEKKVVPILKANKKDYYRLSSAQRRLFILQQIDGNRTEYNIFRSYLIKGNLDKEKIEQCFKKLIERHESLRTSFHNHNGIPAQKVEMNVEFSIQLMNVKELEIEKTIRDFNTLIDISKAPLIRVGLASVGSNQHILMANLHHIISDGTSIGILMEEFMSLYNELDLVDVDIQYKDFSEWQKEVADSEMMKEKEKYWIDKLSGEIPVLNLPIDFARPSVQSFEGSRISFEFSRELSIKIINLASSTGTTLYMMLLSMLKVLLGRYTSQEDIIIASPITGRVQKCLERTVGMFVNTLIIRSQPESSKTFKEFLLEIKRDSLDAFKNQDYQFDELISKLNLNRDLSRNALFDVMFAMQNMAQDTELKTGDDIEIKPYDYYNSSSKFDITLNAFEEEGKIKFIIEYCTKLFKESTIKRFISHFEQLVDAVIQKPEIKILDIDFLLPEEKEKLLYDFNNTKVDYPKDKTIHQLFEEQAQKTPDNVAVFTKEKSINYKELLVMSEKLAKLIHSKGVSSGSAVGLMVDRSIEMIIGIMGVLRAGCCYLPIMPNTPESRLEYIIGDSESPLILTQTAYLEKIPNTVEKINLENVGSISSPQIELLLQNNPNELAYIIYTSGSTGNPKGVMIENHSVVNRIKWMQKKYPIGSGDIILQKTPYTFDVSVWELFWWSFEGASVYMLEPEGEKDPVLILEAIGEKKINVMHFVPSMLETFLNTLEGNSNEFKLESLKYVFSSGEALRPHQVSSFYNLFDKDTNTKLVNLYGPTEATVDVSFFECFRNINYKNIPIGKPIDNTQLYILDKDTLKLQAIGVMGELMISGVCLSRGYLKQEELSLEKFIPHPFKEGERLYRTGDLARWLPDGNIEFLGRIDHQVKIRGFRIELGEIEEVLLKHENVIESVVLAREENGGKYLCAYIVCEDELNEEVLRSYLTGLLPDYMVPAYFVALEKLPLTTSGKVNRKALPLPEVKLSNDYVAPRTKEEKLLVEVWSKVLGFEKIGIYDNFFKLGGDSIKTIQIQARINKLGYTLSVKDIFIYPTISGLSGKLKLKARKVSQEAVCGELYLTPIQHRFFSDQTDLHHYNQNVMLHSKERLDENILRDVFRKLQDHHDVLRIRCKYTNGQYNLYNENTEGYPLSINTYHLESDREFDEKLTGYANQIQSSIDLEKGPLMKIGLFHLPDGDRILIVVHHLIIDGVSWRIIFEDIETLYEQSKGGSKLTLPLKSDSFKNWSEKLTEYSRDNKLLEEKLYWADLLNQEILPLNRERNTKNIKKNELEHKRFTLEEDATSQLLTKINEVYGTDINDILICGLSYGIQRTIGNKKILISLEGHGREELFSEINIARTIGWFTAEYPVLLDMEFSKDLSRQIKIIKESLHQVPMKGIGYGVLKYLTPSVLKEGINFNKVPQIEFNYLGQFDSDFEQMSLFSIAKESGGESVSSNRKAIYDFSFNGMVTGGKLSISVSYKKKYYSEELVCNLLDNYKNSLLEIINHCLNVSNRILTPSDFTYKKLSINEVNDLCKRFNIEDIYKLTPLQEGMLFHAIQDPDSLAYFEQISYRLHGEFNVDLIQKSLNELFKRHEILRTAFLYEGTDIPLQLLLKDRECKFSYNDIRSSNIDDKEKYVSDFKKKDRSQGFLLDQDVLMRVSLLQLDDTEYEIVWSSHHILMDGWCVSLLNNDFFEIYNSLLNNREINLPVLTSYKEYIRWLDNIDKKESLKYWENYLSGYEEQASLPYLAVHESKFVQKKESVIFSQEMSAKLQRITTANNVTVNVFLQAAWSMVLGKYSAKEDIVFGSVVSGRPSDIHDIESIVGLFINAIPVRIQYSGDETFSSLLKKVQQSNLDSEPHHYISLAEIQSQSLLKRDLIDHIMIFENYPIAERMENEDENRSLEMKISGVDVFEQTNYNLTISASFSDVLSVNFIYNSKVYDPKMMIRLKNHFEYAIIGIINNPEVNNSEINIISSEEKQQLLYEFNNTKSDYPKDKTIHQLFEEQVEKTPDNVAICCDEEKICYRDLSIRINQLANYLLNRSCVNKLVGIMSDRSIDMIVGIFGTLKSGNAYLPLDPKQPFERNRKILKDSQTEIVLVDSNEPLFEEIEHVYLGNGNIKKENKTCILNKVESTDLAYVIYTSGSTGTPKGVMISHENVVNFVVGMLAVIPKEDTGAVLSLTTVSFDIFGLELYVPLLKGSSMILVKDERRFDVESISSIVQTQQVSVLQLTPSRLSLMLSDANSKYIFEKIKLVLVGGEELPAVLLSSLQDIFKGKIYNMYGPTETTIWSAFKDVTGERALNIGQPISNTQIYILDNSDKLQPIGIVGELCIGGAGLARGYYKNEELTNEKFIPNPFNEGERLYRTGDVARWLPDGNIEFLGRIDHQVKIRGFRIELGEIENALLKHEEVKECVVIAREDNEDKYLCSYVIKNEESEHNSKEDLGLRKFLSESLPDYMIPLYFVILESLPLTPNGKIDRKALPKPEIKAGEDYVPADNETEEKVVAIWSELLNIPSEEISVITSFFELGGHSLKAINLIAIIYKKFNYELSMMDLFKKPTIREVSEIILASEWLDNQELLNNIEKEEIIL